MMSSLGSPRSARRWACVLALSLAIAACGGNGDDDTPAPAPSPAPAPAPAVGDLVEAERVGRITADEVSAALAADADKVSGVTPRYNVVAYRLSYWTEDKNGALTKASGLVAVPEGSGAAPVLSYQHATTFTNANAPSLNLQPNEPPVALASQGYIVVASDYVGFALSQGQDHPYLRSRPTARAVIDMLTAAQAWRSTQGVTDTGKLYLVG